MSTCSCGCGERESQMTQIVISRIGALVVMLYRTGKYCCFSGTSSWKEFAHLHERIHHRDMESICRNKDRTKPSRCTLLAPSSCVTFPSSTCINLTSPDLSWIKATPCFPRNLIQSVYFILLQSTASPLRSFRKTFVPLVSPLIPKLPALAKQLHHPGQVR